MAKNRTLFGIVAGPKGELFSNATFRLHMGNGVSETDINIFEHGNLRLLDRWEKFQVIIEEHPSTGIIFERELHVSMERNRKGVNVLHLKEGPRFFETARGTTFPWLLVRFLSNTIPEITTWKHLV